MPRVSKAQTQGNRIAIEQASVQLFKERGLRGTSVADLMAAAGLTHGGFYGHFESKDALAAVACTRAFEGSAERWKKRMAGQHTPAQAMTALVDGYLSARNRASPGTGCPMAGLATDVAREPDDKPVRAAYVEGLDAMVDMLAGVQASGDAAHDRAEALADLSTLVGAMVLARATRGAPMSNQILAAARARLLEPKAVTP